MTLEQVTRWSATENQTHLRYGQPIMMQCLFGIIDGRTTDDLGFHLDRSYEIGRAKAWQEHNAYAARYAMSELFKLIDMRSQELAAHIPHYAARIESHYLIAAE